MVGEIVNGDATLAVSLGMDAAVLGLAGRMAGLALPARRWGLGAAVATLPTAAGLAGGPHIVLPLAWAWPVVVSAVAFGPSPRATIRGAGAVYAVSVALGGTVLALAGAGVPLFAALGGSLAAAVGLGRFWRRRVARPWLAARGRVPVRVVAGGRPVELVALWDSGNLLRDPVEGRPVLLAGLAAVEAALHPALRAWAAGVLAGREERPPAGYERSAGTLRARTAAGQGRIPVVHADAAQVEVDGRWQALSPLAIGMVAEPIDPDAAFNALLHPDCLETFRSMGA
ncbi:MAG: sigma-E processing peptidase SpoIIGA [Actinomycetia bacterium]|nr:sigma-E processing peptidase SpoIIGA [Actinomycetes bacterium]